LGATTPSYDLETEIESRYPTDHIKEDLVHQAAQDFIGEIAQYPPLFSALKKEGKRLYELAREGKTTDLKARTVHISKFEIKKIALPEIYFLVECSKGTYIRSLAHDFGVKLESGAYLSSLKRTESGSYSLKDAFTMESVVQVDSDKNIKSVKLTS
jgi:tRNA pseudouridine55 synthase